MSPTEFQSRAAFMLSKPWILWIPYLVWLVFLGLLLLGMWFGDTQARVIVGLFLVGMIYLLYQMHVGVNNLANYVYRTRLEGGSVELRSIRAQVTLDVSSLSYELLETNKAFPTILFPAGSQVLRISAEDHSFLISSSTPVFQSVLDLLDAHSRSQLP